MRVLIDGHLKYHLDSHRRQSTSRRDGKLRRQPANLFARFKMNLVEDSKSSLPPHQPPPPSLSTPSQPVLPLPIPLISQLYPANAARISLFIYTLIPAIQGKSKESKRIKMEPRYIRPPSALETCVRTIPYIRPPCSVFSRSRLPIYDCLSLSLVEPYGPPPPFSPPSRTCI